MASHGFFLLLCWSASLFLAGAQEGFLNIDCGLTGTSDYTNQADNLTQTPDDIYVESGVKTPIDPMYSALNNIEHRVYNTVRYFPTYKRNCYRLPATKGTKYKYLLRSSFMYGNYDRLNRPPSFDVYFGVDLWDTVKLDNSTHHYRSELVAEATSTTFYVCLVNVGKGTPFISGLKLRPLTQNMYAPANSSQALTTHKRVDVGGNSSTSIRWPGDRYDRRWDPDYGAYGTPKSTRESVTEDVHDGHPSFGLPVPVMQTAVYSREIVIRWVGAQDSSFYLFLDFADVVKPASGGPRQMNVQLNGQDWRATNVTYLLSSFLYTEAPTVDSQYSFSIRSTNASDEGAVLNAFEVYKVFQLSGSATDTIDVLVLTDIKQFYQLKKNWVGDPCFPKDYPWDGIECDDSSTPKIQTLDLSNSELNGTITGLISKLTALKTLNLSGNNLYGPVPDVLQELRNVLHIDLSNNHLSGSIPLSLLERNKSGEIVLSIENNPLICQSDRCSKDRKGRSLVIVISVVVPLAVAALILFLVINMIKRRKQGKLEVGRAVTMNREMIGSPLWPHATPGYSKNGIFTYSEVMAMTNNFQKVIGKGGSATVFYGVLNDGREVAVKKMATSLVERGPKEFAAEVKMLMQVHHKHLTPFVGYCNDQTEMILIYEYMSNGNLQKLLSDKTANVLNWRQRLQIALDAAIGLEYLHSGCIPAFIHRDVKSSNILLNEKLEAKIADFGLSKSIISDEFSHVTTGVAGTIGYLDPEYIYTSKLTEKSDVYSFGVVLFELITGQPAIATDAEGQRFSLVQIVVSELRSGDINSIIDPRLHGQYEISSIWKVAETAMTCTSEKSVVRPTMTLVVAQLKEAMEMEASTERSGSWRILASPSDSLSGGRTTLSATGLSDTDVAIYPSAR
ncbi:putative leucine-rich repeat receptor-like protein kinase At2g19210 isoform X2 [Nymphaea colorata]|uniref:putative leucine-rich repeat receptor-like protein kinase At2g19210 isoform X2 n=1 Tax=Nymphaea colorata TaxID=210225 RepID=UPI00129E6CDA|nr:putative leucine-rich repeat receptor-like protein kinase At2g19210 isoform X2 [Nymphaea colorata]